MALVSALSVYVEPLAGDARVAVLGNGELGLDAQLLALGARTVHLYDPDPARVARIEDEVPRAVSVRTLRDDFDVRDGAFDLVIIPDIGALPDPSGIIVKLRRIIDARGSVVAMGRARTPASSRDAEECTDDVFPEITPAAVEYAELYDLFALQFENVTMTGVVPFAGVVFAELGARDDVAVSVDTRLAAADATAAQVFVVIASREDTVLDPYAIVQVPAADEDTRFETRETTFPPSAARAQEAKEQDARAAEAAAAFAQMQLKAELLASQLDEHRARLAAAEGRGAEHAARVEQLALERDVALTRATELEGILDAAQQSLASLERRLEAAEQGMLERDDQIAALNAELDASAAAGENIEVAAVMDPALVGELVNRAERAEASLALNVADLAQVAEAHATETASLEAQLRERARVIAEMDRELGRREQLVRELVTALEEAREGMQGAPTFEAAPLPPAPGHSPEEVARLRRRLDELALEVARREGELVARAWQITELENEKGRTVSQTLPAAGSPEGLERDLARAKDEIDALRQALTQEHAARVAVESGEELSRARAELARQAALLDQMRGPREAGAKG